MIRFLSVVSLASVTACVLLTIEAIADQNPALTVMATVWLVVSLLLVPVIWTLRTR